jgi:hypothetical protein
MNTIRFLVAGALAAASLSAQAMGSYANVVIHDRETGRELPIHWHEGRAYVVGKPGNEYQIGLRNRRAQDVLAVVSVDGVNVVSGETAHTKQSGYVLSPWQRTDIRGWRKSMNEVASFYFTSLGGSYAARTGRPDHVGVIGVALFTRKRVEPPVTITPVETQPYSEARREKSDSATSGYEAKRLQQPPAAASAPLGTGHGRREESQTRWVDFQRSDTPVETITIHYDSYRNLVALGVLSQPVAPRHPNPFPGFVPDPV